MVTSHMWLFTSAKITLITLKTQFLSCTSLTAIQLVQVPNPCITANSADSTACPHYLSEIGRMLEMVTSGSFSSTLSIPQAASESQREPKVSPKEKGLSLYLGRYQNSSEKPVKEQNSQVYAPATALLWGSRSKCSNIIKQVKL
ncbi:rCG26299 [Rattus norvegicus]|uniref:RCG26299 n=1 Tax=Rattus norvegicus TaxID=10116 RepID=A6HNC5_RAT|nr:rCG26299 [Rattus norvegicus]